MDTGEAGAAGVREEAEEAVMWLKVAGGIDQIHVPGREESLAQGRGTATLSSLGGLAQALPSLKASPIILQQPPSPPLPNSTCLDPDYLTGENEGGPRKQESKSRRGDEGVSYQ